MESRKNDVPGERGLNRNLRCFKVADFSHHYFVRVLAQKCAQTPGEVQSDLVVYLNLHDSVDFIFDRIL